MRNKTRILLIVFVVLSVAFLSATFSPSGRSIVKQVAIGLLEKVEGWRVPDGSRVHLAPRSFVERFLFAHDPLIVFPKSPVVKKGDPIELTVFNQLDAQAYLRVVNFTTGVSEHQRSELEGLDKDIRVLYSSFSGFERAGARTIFFDSRDLDGWVNIVVEDSSGRKRFVPVFVESAIKFDIVFVESTDTLNAYDSSFGVPSFYHKENKYLGAMTKPLYSPRLYEITPAPEKIHCNDHLINADLVLKKFLSDREVRFSTVSDLWLDDFENLKKVRLLIFGAHNEYWTEAKARSVIRFVESGGSVLFFGGNTAWRQVIRHQNFDHFYGSGLRTHSPVFEKLVSKVLGSYFTKQDYATWAPFRVKNVAKWEDIFGIRVSESQEIATHTSFSHCKDRINGGSGHETDKKVSTSDDFVSLAKGQNNKGGADLLYREFPQGGKVLNFGSVALWHALDDPVIAPLIQTFIAQALIRKPE